MSLFGKAAKAVGVPVLAIKVGAAVLAILAVVTAYIVWENSVQREAVENRDNEVNLDAETKARKADGNAAQQQREDDARNAAEGAELGEILENDPEADQPLSDLDRAYLRCVRLQQRARANNEPAPAC